MQYFSEEHSSEVVKQQYKNCKDQRLKKIMESAIDHLHAFIKDFMGTSSTKGASGSFDSGGKTTKTITVDKGVITQIK